MRCRKYYVAEGPRAVRLAVASLTLAATVALPFTAWPEEPLPPLDPIWNKAKVDPERDKKRSAGNEEQDINIAPRATTGTSRDKAESVDTPRAKRSGSSHKEKTPEIKRERQQVNFDAGKADPADSPKVTVIKGEDFPEYMNMAKAGDAEGMRLVGVCYLYGTGVEKDQRLAWDWIGKSASAGNTEAQYDLGCLYRDGLGVKQNFTESAYWFRRAARNGNAAAMINIARQFAEGKGVLQDYRIAAENYWRAAERGEAEGMYQYAVMLRDGIGVDRDRSKSLRWFEEASKRDYKDAGLQAEQLRKSGVKASAGPAHKSGGKGSATKATSKRGGKKGKKR